MEATDWPQVARIYEEGLLTRMATFETEVPTQEAWDRAHLPACRWVAVQVAGDGDGSPAGNRTGPVVGWAALSPVSSRPAYAGVAEVSVYVSREAWGSGVGTGLLEQLVSDSEEAGIWTLQASIFAENEGSIRLHRRCGFRVVGRRERVARLEDVWRDTVLMERRSAVVGMSGS